MKKYTDQGKVDTRSGFGAGLLEAGRKDSRVVAMTADLKGSLKMDAFAAEFPERFISAVLPRLIWLAPPQVLQSPARCLS